jgi:hypothetical protein
LSVLTVKKEQRSAWSSHICCSSEANLLIRDVAVTSLTLAEWFSMCHCLSIAGGTQLRILCEN